MYKLILTHEVLPGRLKEMMAWFKQADESRKKQDPAYKPYKRYITCFGSAHKVVIEMEVKDPAKADWIWEGAYAERSSGPGDFSAMIVPGRTEVLLLKELDLSS